MVTELLVESQIEDGRRFVEQLVRDGFEVTVAFWVKTSEEGSWHLFIASPSVDAEKPSGAYRKVYASLSKIPDIGISPSDIKLISSTNPIAQDALEMRGDRYPGRISTLYQGKRLGGLSIREAYIYPPLVSLRQSYSVAYHRKEKTNTWRAKTKKEEMYRDMRAKGAVAYSTGRWEGETEEEENHATVSVLLEVDPQFDDQNLIFIPQIRQIMTCQARDLADQMFKTRHPDATIEHIEHAEGMDEG
jgi:hypothetical protein